MSHERGTLRVSADRRGNFVCQDLTANDHQAWTAYTLTASGAASRQIAQKAYFDAPPPGGEKETLGVLKFQIPLTGRDFSFETETITLKWKSGSSVRERTRRRRRRYGVVCVPGWKPVQFQQHIAGSGQPTLSGHARQSLPKLRRRAVHGRLPGRARRHHRRNLPALSGWQRGRCDTLRQIFDPGGFQRTGDVGGQTGRRFSVPFVQLSVADGLSQNTV